MQQIPEEDGISHINVFSGGKTELGRQLSHLIYMPWNTDDGDFNSFEGWWFWQLASAGSQLKLFSLDNKEDLRSLVGLEAKELGKRLCDDRCWPSDAELPGFQQKYEKAARARLQQYPALAELLRDSKLPLVHYYVFKKNGNSPTVITDKRGDWVVALWDKLRAELR